MAYYCVMAMRSSFDLASGYTIGKNMQTLDERSVLIRCIFLETVAGELQIFKYVCTRYLVKDYYILARVILGLVCAMKTISNYTINIHTT